MVHDGVVLECLGQGREKRKIVLGFLVGQKYENETDVLVMSSSKESSCRAATDGRHRPVHLDAGVRHHALADVIVERFPACPLSTFLRFGAVAECVKGLNQLGVGGLEVLSRSIIRLRKCNGLCAWLPKDDHRKFSARKLSLVDYFSYSSRRFSVHRSSLRQGRR